MKKKQLVLTLSAIVLAVAGITATRANVKAGPYYYNPSSCTTFPGDVCSHRGSKVCTEDFLGGTYTIYTDVNCQTALSWDGSAN